MIAPRMRWLLVAAIAGCSTSPDEIELTQTVTTNMTFGFTCRSTTTGTGAEAVYWRLFSLVDEGARAGFHVDSVTFGMFGTPPTGTPPLYFPSSDEQHVDVALYSYFGPVDSQTLDLSQRVLLNHAPASFDAPTSPQLVNTLMPTLVTDTEYLLVEVHPDFSSAAGKHFDLGANSDGETATGYARDCVTMNVEPALAYTTPVTGPDTHWAWVIYLTGQIIPDVHEHPPSR